MKNEENDIILSFLQRLQAVARPLDLTIEQHSLQALFFYFLDESKYKNHYLQNQQRNIVYLSEAETVCQKLGEAAYAIKGVDLCQRLYPNLSLRPMTDIDICFESLGEAQKVLESIGYQEVPEKKWSANSHKLTMIKETPQLNYTVEIHNSLFPGGKFESDLSNETYFVYLCSHLAHQHNFLKLFWLVDLAIFVQKMPMDWAKVKTEAVRVSRVRAVEYCKQALFLFWPDLIQKPSGSSVLSKEFLIYPKASIWKNLIVKHRTKDSFWEAVRYDYEWLKCHLVSRGQEGL